MPRDRDNEFYDYKAPTELTAAELQVAVRKVTSGQPLTPKEAAAVGVSEPSSITPTPAPTPTPIPTPTWVRASTVNTVNGPVDVDANGLASDGSRPVPFTANTKASGVPAGFTAGPFPKELEQFFGSSSGVLGYRIETVTDKNGKTYNQLSVATGPNSSQTYGAGFTTDASGKYVTYSPPTDSTDSPTPTIIKPTTITSTVSTTNTSAADTTKYNERMSVYASMADRFNKYGLTGLANKIKELAIAGATEATITLQLQETPEYQQRFAANADRIKKGLATLTPAEYVNVEDSYRQVLRAYGLKQFDNDAYVRQFIANDMSPTELSNRVVTAVQRVQNADPAIINQLKQYYGIGAPDMVAYVLDPEQQFQKIERQIAASEIGVAAGRQGLTAGVSVAEQLAAQGVSQAEAQKGYATIADILPTAEKLSDIYGTTLDEYRQAEGEQEVFNSLASAQRKRQKLTAREIAAFSGSSGTNKTSLTTSSVGQY
jgi:hypothetical protein